MTRLRKPRTKDPEILAIYELIKALLPLDQDQRARVLEWAFQRFVVAETNVKAEDWRQAQETIA